MADIASSELNLRELRILHALLHERSITRTAELLATTQPGISKVLRHLRAQFGDPLFVRNGHAMQPTAKALEIADQLRTLLGVADSLRASATVFDPVRSDRTFSLLLYRCRDDPLPASPDRARGCHRAQGQYSGDAAGLTSVRTQAGSR